MAMETFTLDRLKLSVCHRSISFIIAMVLPLKPLQFYGSSLPRPRVYQDVKFNDHRVDPPPSVNDALLSWAQDAPWSMGGLSNKRTRGHGKLDGSARKLRNLPEEPEDVNVNPVVISTQKEANLKVLPSSSSKLKNIEKSVGRGQVKMTAKARETNLGDDADELEEIESTPVRKMRKIRSVGSLEKSKVMESTPVSKKQADGSSSVNKNDSESNKNVAASSPQARRSLRRRCVVEENEEIEMSTTVTAALEVKKNDIDVHRSVLQTRSAKKKSAIHDGRGSVSSAKKKSARKVLLRDTEDDVDSDDGLEEFMKLKGRTIRRSSRVGAVKTKASPVHEPSDSEEI